MPALIVLSLALSLPAMATPTKVVTVASVDALYNAVNDPSNHDAEVRVAPGYYRLGAARVLPNGKSVARPHEGRLILQARMTLSGGNQYALVNGTPAPRDDAGEVFADPASETILDGSDLLGGTFALAGTDAIVRIGRANAVRGLTIRSNPDAKAAIAVDQLDHGAMSAEVSDCTLEAVAGAGRRGLMIPEPFEAFAGSSATIVLRRNVIRHHRGDFGFGVQAVRFQTSDLTVDLGLEHNVIYDNSIGLFVPNLSVADSTTTVISTSNVYRANDDGIVILGGRDFGFDVGSFRNNTVLVSTDDEIVQGFYDAIFVIAGLRDGDAAPENSDNSVSVTFDGTQFVSPTGPQNGELSGGRVDVAVFGALSNFYPDQGAGFRNTVEMLLTGLAAPPVAGESVYVYALDADVPEPTNRVVFVGGIEALPGNNPDVPIVLLQ